MARPRSSASARTAGGESGEPMRSFSNTSTPSKPARTAAFSFSSSVPLRHTLAIPLRTRDLGCPDQRREVAQHALAVGLAAGEEGEGERGLEDRHAAAVE